MEYSNMCRIAKSHSQFVECNILATQYATIKYNDLFTFHQYANMKPSSPKVLAKL